MTDDIDDAAEADGPAQRLALAELLDRALAKGIVVRGDATISIADVDLVYVGLKALLASVDTADQLRAGWPPGDRDVLPLRDR